MPVALPLGRFLLACILAATAAFATGSASASAAEYARNYESQITGFTDPSGVSIDNNEDVWITDPGNGGLISEFDPLPSTTKIGEQDGEGHFRFNGILIETASLDSADGRLYVGDSEFPAFHVFQGTGPWVATSPVLGNNSIHLAVDNSGTTSDGRVYAALDGGAISGGSGGGAIVAFDADVNGSESIGPKANFSASAPYIEGNKLIGAPTGPGGSTEFFTVPGSGRPWRLAVDGSGNIYVVAKGTDAVYEYASSGEFIRQITETPEGPFVEANGVAVDPSNGDILIVDAGKKAIDEFDPSGSFLGQITGAGTPAGSFSSLSGGVAVNPNGNLYVADSGNGVVDIFEPAVKLPKVTYLPVENITPRTATLKASVDPNGGGDVETCEFEYGTVAFHGNTIPCSPDPASSPPGSHFTSFTDVAAAISGLQAETVYYYRIIATNPNGTEHGPDHTFETGLAVAGVTTEAAEDVTNESAVLAGSYIGNGEDTSYYFEYGTSPNYGHVTSTVDNGEAGGLQRVSASISSLPTNTTYYFRLIAENDEGVAVAHNEQSFTTYQAPTIEGFSTSDVTATSAILRARINPHGLPAGTEAECRFEYGTTTSYGDSVPCPGSLSGTTPQAVEVEISALQPGVPYHFRLIATNRWGNVISPDQSFEFFPPACPNSAVRQQTGAGYLPDCRAYELVSPPNANGSLLFTGGPNTGRATNPSRFSFVAAFSSLPGAEPIDTVGDLYVSTRTPTGWETNYIGPSGSEAGCFGSPPNDPWSRTGTSWPKVQSHVITDPSMSSFIDFAIGSPVSCVGFQNGIGDATGPIDPPSNLGHVWAADGSSLGTLPAGLTPTEVAALRCPNQPGRSAYQNYGLCHGDVAASSDLRHFFFSSNLLNYTPGGSTEESGGAYDYDRATGALTRISGLAAGGQIAPGDATDFPSKRALTTPFIHFAAVSSDGSHVLMTNATSSEVCLIEDCRRPTDEPLHLYMSVDGESALDVSESQLTHEDVAVDYVGMTPDGSKVYFTSGEHLAVDEHGNVEDPHHFGASLYMWEAAKAIHGEDPLTLISKANPGSPAQAGDTGECHPLESWTVACGVTVYSPKYLSEAQAARGGNGVSDGPIAANGDIYFSSPEQLAGDHGVLNQQNLYDYRQGRLQFVTTFPVENMCLEGTIFADGYHYLQHDGVFTPEFIRHCAPSSTCLTSGAELDETEFEGVRYRGSEYESCSEGPIARLEITPDDTRMAFVTPARITAYDNLDPQGTCRHGTFGEPMGETHCTEMYSYDPVDESLTCDSCNPNGRPPTSDAYASQDGLFLTDDGRTFFSTEEALVPADTNQGTDVYEFVDGRPRLITPGTGTAAPGQAASAVGEQVATGLIGVSADGTDVYFSTFDTLVSEDRNGNFLKFYDARTNGGFPHSPAAQPCAAAEECHGPGTEPPVLPAGGTSATLTGGNVTRHRRHGKRHHKRATHKRHRTRGGKK
jgi:hypothetical protein